MKVILDTDPGLGQIGSDIDDGLAIALALRSPELEVLGLTIVCGNVDAEVGHAVGRSLAERLGCPDLPVLTGARRPLERGIEDVRALFAAVLPPADDEARPPGRVTAADAHGSADIAEVAPGGTESGATAPGESGPPLPMDVTPSDWDDLAAARFLVEQTRAHPGQVSVIAIGPATNLALALRLDPGFATNAAELVLMAGAATTYAQNVTVVGDFNAYVDPEALDVVLRSGARVRMVGLDQTSRVMLTRGDAARLRSGSDPFGRWAGQCAEAWIDYLHRAFPGRPEHAEACFLHDPLVVAAALDPTLCTWEQAHVEVVLGCEAARGLVIADRGLALRPPGPANATVAVDTDLERFREFFTARIAPSDTPSPDGPAASSAPPSDSEPTQAPASFTPTEP